MSKKYYKCISRNGSISEGNYPSLRRLIGRLFFGEKFTVIGDWIEFSN